MHHPKNKVLRRKLHCQSLPVETLCYQGVHKSPAAPSLLSGGEEPVLVTWNIGRGHNRPTYTLPRISKGCLTHISSYDRFSSNEDTGSLDVIIRSMDTTLQLIHGHRHAVKWKIQGVASAMNEWCVVPSVWKSPFLGISDEMRPSTLNLFRCFCNGCIADRERRLSFLVLTRIGIANYCRRSVINAYLKNRMYFKYCNRICPWHSNLSIHSKYCHNSQNFSKQQCVSTENNTS